MNGLLGIGNKKRDASRPFFLSCAMNPVGLQAGAVDAIA